LFSRVETLVSLSEPLQFEDITLSLFKPESVVQVVPAVQAVPERDVVHAADLVVHAIRTFA
jgi:hypothetical protein